MESWVAAGRGIGVARKLRHPVACVDPSALVRRALHCTVAMVSFLKKWFLPNDLLQITQPALQ